MTQKKKTFLWLAASVVLALAVASVFLFRDSSRTYPNRNPIGERFPSVVGQSLEKVPTDIPTAFAGEPVVLLVGYKQDAQFDLDRWLMGLLQTEVEMRIVEIPTIPGLLPSMASGWIDNGMRSGIPKEDWGVVVTLYGEAARPVAELTGTERGRIGRVIVLDASGTVAWFDDEGYSVRKALEVAKLVSTLSAP
jgi:hypothetical protein